MLITNLTLGYGKYTQIPQIWKIIHPSTLTHENPKIPLNFLFMLSLIFLSVYPNMGSFYFVCWARECGSNDVEQGKYTRLPSTLQAPKPLSSLSLLQPISFVGTVAHSWPSRSRTGCHALESLRQLFLLRGRDENGDVRDDDDFRANPWLSALDFLRKEGVRIHCVN